MLWERPSHIMVLPDIVVFYTPRLKETLEEVFSMIEAGYDVTNSGWGFHTWAGERHGLTLEIDHHGLGFNVVLEPPLWSDIIPALMRVKTVGIIGDGRYYHASQGSVTPFILDVRNVYHPTMFKVFNVDTGLRAMIPSLVDLEQRWNPRGIVTYLLAILKDAGADTSENPGDSLGECPF